MNTLKQVISEINKFVTGHTILEGFAFDDISNYNTAIEGHKFPLLFLSPQAIVPANVGKLGYVCELIISDIVDEYRSYDNVTSDISTLLSEFLTFFDENNEFFYFQIKHNNNFTFFPNGYDKSAGVYGTIILEVPNTFSHENIRMK